MAKKKRIKAPKTRNNGRWTEGEYFQRIRAALRRVFRFWEPMQIALKKASRPSQSTNKKLKWEYQCAYCKKWFPRKQVQIDHIVECGSLNNYDDLIPFLKRLTPENPNSFQVLCKKDHKKKTELFKKSLYEKKRHKKRTEENRPHAQMDDNMGN